jgi:ribosomal protein S18 acetylase RimI-like enzyme
MFSRIYHFLKGRSPLHPAVIAGRLTPITFRRFTAEALPQCLELYALNEPGRFPKGAASEYEKALKQGKQYFLVAESNGQIIASGGVEYFKRRDIAVFFFGLVHPNHFGRGVGTALLLARLALLKPDRPAYHVLIFAVKDSFGFYRRFGFTNLSPWKDSQGDKHPSGHLHFTSREILGCRALLRDNKIGFPEDEDQIPFHDAQGQTLPIRS